MSEFPANSSLPEPSSVRWQIVALLAAFSFMSHFTRVGMPVAGAALRADFGLSSTELGFVYSSFLFGYVLCMIPGGWFGDRYGGKRALVMMGFGSAALCGLTGTVGLVAMAGAVLMPLVVVRVLLGMFTSPLYPASGRIVVQWIPLHQRALANALVTAAAPLGAALTWVVFAWLVDRFDWRAAFGITGAATAALTTAWIWYATDYPEGHRSASLAERRWIAQDGPLVGSIPPQRAVSAPTGWGAIFRNRSLLLLTASYAAVGYFEYLFWYWMQHYFEQVLHLETGQARLYAMFPSLAMVVSMPLGGWISDRLASKLGRRTGRAIVPIVGMTASALLLLAGISATNPNWIVTWFTLALGAVGASEGPFWTTAIELGGTRGSTAAALCNTGGNAGGILAPIIAPWIGEHFGWPWAMRLGSAVCLLGALLWFWIVAPQRDELARDPAVDYDCDLPPISVAS